MNGSYVRMECQLRKRVKERGEPSGREFNIYWVPIRYQTLLGAEVKKVNEIWIPFVLKELTGRQERQTCAYIMTIQ